MRVENWFGKGLTAAVLVAALVITAGTGVCSTPKKVAVIPFTMNSPQDLGFLRNGLFSMLSSRLSDPGKVEVLDRQTVDKAMDKAKGAGLAEGLNEANARIIAAELGADYILFGSLTHFGESVSLDARMVDVTGEKQTLAFFEQSNAMGDVIPLVNTFAGDINEKVFNRRIDNQLYTQPVPQEAPAPGALQHAMGGGVYGGGMMAMQASQGFATHLTVKDIVRGMATGDLNQDGRLELVTATDYALQIYRMDGQMLTLEQTLTYPDYLRIVGLDISDINGNGTPEIFVSALTIHKDSLASFVVEHNGTSYGTLIEDEARYFRVMTTPEGNQVLLGQEKGTDPFSGDIHTMGYSGKEYTEEKRVRLPRGTSVLALARGPVRDEAADQYLSINKHGRLVLIGDTGSMEWESSAKYGGTNNVWLMPKAETDSSYRERIYFHPRIKFFTLGEDEKKKAFVVKNTEIGGGSFGRYKKFEKGHIEIMAWNGISLAPVFQTMPVQGWICDYDIVDLDGDGAEELVVAVVSRTNLAILTKDKSSSIISYKIK